MKNFLSSKLAEIILAWFIGALFFLLFIRFALHSDWTTTIYLSIFLPVLAGAYCYLKDHIIKTYEKTELQEQKNESLQIVTENQKQEAIKSIVSEKPTWDDLLSLDKECLFEKLDQLLSEKEIPKVQTLIEVSVGRKSLTWKGPQLVAVLSFLESYSSKKQNDKKVLQKIIDTYDQLGRFRYDYLERDFKGAYPLLEIMHKHAPKLRWLHISSLQETNK